MNGLKMISPEGVTALRTFADKLPISVTNIEDDTKRLNATYHSVEADLGVRAESIESLLLIVESAAEKANEAITELPKAMHAKADEIEEFLAEQLTI